MLVKLDGLLYEIPRLYEYPSEIEARLNSMNFSVCGYEPDLDECDIQTMRPLKSRFYYRGKRVNIEIVSGKPDYHFDAPR